MSVKDPDEIERNDDQHTAQGLPPQPPSVSDQPPPHRQGNDGTDYKGSPLDGARFIVEVVTLLVLFLYTVTTVQILTENKRTNQMAQQIFQTTERPYLTLGRKDGMLAEFAEAKDPNAQVGLRLYFQNGGHLPATDVAISTLVYTLPPFAPPAGHDVPLLRSRNKRTGAVTKQGGGKSISGDATYVHPVADVFSQTVLDQARTANSLLGVDVTVQYCDDFGEYFCKRYSLYY